MYFEAEDGAKLYYEINGPKSGKPIIFLHGWGIGSAFFSEQIAPLVNEGYKVITMDARSHGKSERNTKYIKTFQDQLLDLMYMDFKSLLIHLNLKEKFSLIGHSAGGGISIAFATQTELKKYIASMVILNSAYTISEHPSGLLLWELVPFFVNVIYNPVLRSGYKLVLRSNATISALSLALQRPRKNVKKWIEDLITIPKEQLIREYQNFKRYNIRQHLKDIECPTLIIGAELDMITPAYMSKKMAKEIPNAELIIIKNAGHGSMIEQPQLVNRKIIEFLQRHFPAKN
ncbi:MAG: alpha/beta fold hydrolase [Candidatus Helarchaeota archaeon]